jgi:phenylacetate-CoA ligase
VQVELSEEMFTDKVSDIEDLKNTIAERIKSVVGIAAKITLVAPKSLPRSEGKAKRVIDRRNLTNA